MFNNNIKLVTTQLVTAQNKITELGDKIQALEKLLASAVIEQAETRRACDSQLAHMQKEQVIALDLQSKKHEVAIISSNTVGQEKIAKLSQENAILGKEVEILTKAFNNMGFDVKDMKEILNKLVDGIVSKNEVSIIK